MAAPRFRRWSAPPVPRWRRSPRELSTPRNRDRAEREKSRQVSPASPACGQQGPETARSVDITAAKIIVAGRGGKKRRHRYRANWPACWVEADVSRPVAEELQWLPEEVYLGIFGQDGQTVLCLAQLSAISAYHRHTDSKVIF
jgi:electron transfer flavoprotein alpha subunit